MRTRLLLGIVGSLVGCRPEPVAYDPLDFLAIGVDPMAEATREEDALRARGYRVVTRVDGRLFVALGARSSGNGATAVRVITRNGIALGADAPAREHPTWRRVELVERPGGVDLDFDENHAPEVLLRVDDEVRPLPCLVVVRVRESDRGDAFEVPIDARAYGPRACAEEVVDIDRDGSFELLVGQRPWFVHGAPLPRLLVPFVAHDGEFVAGSEAQIRDVAEASVGAMREQLAIARARPDAVEVLRLAAEIALAEAAMGVPDAERRAAFDAAVAGLAFDAPGLELIGLVRRSLGG